MSDLEFSFAFDPGDTSRAMLSEAHDTVRALYSSLGAPPGAVPRHGPSSMPSPTPGAVGGPPRGAAPTGSTDPAHDAAVRLLEELQHNVAELTAAAPDLLPLSSEQLQASGLNPAPIAAALARDHRFYWLRIPYTLQPRSDFRFERLEIAIEINPGAGARRPRILSALPTSEFTTLAAATTELSVGIDEGMQFSVAAGSRAAAPGGDAAGAQVAAHAGAKLGFVAGPFVYRVRKAVIERGTLPSERVFWRISETETLSEAPPELIAVIAVPDETRELRIAAALQAYASGAVLTMTLGGFLKYLGNKLAQFFTSGAPARSTQVWDLTPRLSHRP